MILSLRVPTDDDWDSILALAHAAIPWDSEGNEEWLHNRRTFPNRRLHYLVEDEIGAIRGYGAAEEGPDKDIYRVFLVMSAEDLQGDPGDIVFDRLVDDLAKLGARGLWAREYAEDQTIRTDLERRGFVEQTRFTPPGEREMVVLVRTPTVPT